MRGKIRKRAGGLLNTVGRIFFERCQCHVDEKYYDPGVYVLVGKLGVSWSFSQWGNLFEKPSKEFASKVSKPLPPSAEEPYILAVC
jgi:hypothetical protein